MVDPVRSLPTKIGISPRYEWRDDNGIYRRGIDRRVLVGYEVRQLLEVRIRDMEKNGKIWKEKIKNIGQEM